MSIDQTLSGGETGTGMPRLPRLVSGASLFSTILVVPAGAACVAMMLHVILDVAGRTFFNHPFAGTLEITANWWMVSLVFLAFGYTQLQREHIRATVITDLLPPAWQRGAEIGAVVLLGLLSAAMGYFGWISAVDAYAIKQGAAGGIPVWQFQFVVPIGCLALVLQCIASVYEIVVRFERESHAEELI